MQSVNCKSDNNEGQLSITKDGNIEFTSSSSTSWTFSINDILQLMVSKKPPFTGAKIVFNNKESKILNFSAAEHRTLFSDTIDTETKRLEKEEEERETQQRKNNIKQEEVASAALQQDAAAAPIVDVDEDEDIIMTKRRAWLTDDEMSSQVFQLLSQVSAFENNSTTRSKNSSNKTTSSSSKKTSLSKGDRTSLLTTDGADANKNDDDDDDDDEEQEDSLLHQVLLEEEQKFFSDPERQEVTSASVYDALNSLVDPQTKTLKPINQATAATIFNQIPHLASVYNRVVHSAEDEMLFWVSVVRRRLFFSRTKLDAELAKCGPTLCPLTGEHLDNNNDVKTNNNNNYSNEKKSGTAAVEEDLLEEEKWELDQQEQKPKHDQVRDYQKSRGQQHKTVSNNSNNIAAALASELNFASGKIVDDLQHQQNQQLQQGVVENNKKVGLLGDVESARSLQFGALSEAEKLESKKMQNQTHHHEQLRRGRNEDDEEVSMLMKKPDNSANNTSVKNKNESGEQMKRIHNVVAKKLLSTSSSDDVSTSNNSNTDEWKTIYVGNVVQNTTLAIIRNGHHQSLSSPTPSKQQIMNVTNSEDVKPNLQHNNKKNGSSNKTQNVGSTSKFVHGRAAAYLVRVFWRKAKDVFALRNELVALNKNKKSSSSSSAAVMSKQQRKLDSGVVRLKGLKTSLSRVLEQWNVDAVVSPSNKNDAQSLSQQQRSSAKDAAEKAQWNDSLAQIGQVVSLF